MANDRAAGPHERHRGPLSPGRRSLAVAVLWVATACCDQGGSVAPAAPAARTFDLGGGVTAALGNDGSFSIVTGGAGGATVLATAPGTPLFARTSDPDNPDNWHDPTQAHPDLTTLPIDATTVTAEVVDDGSTTRAVHLVVPQQPDDTALVSLALAADDGFSTGLGEQFAHVSASGRISPMFLTVGSPWESDTNEAHVPVPFLVSSSGWGVFVASREAGAFDVASSDPSMTKVTFEGRTLDVWFFVDPDPLAIVARFNRLAGLPRPLPRWALSPIHWRHWASADDVVSIATEYRQRHIPSSALWLDDGWQTAEDTFAISPAIFGDSQTMMAQLASLGFRVMAWTSPYLEQPHGAPIDEAQQLYQQGAQDHFFVEDGSGNVYSSLDSPIKGGAGIVDFTRGDANAFWDGLVARATGAGIHGFKCDYGEDFIPNLLGQRNPVAFSDGTTARTARLFPIEEHTTYHAALDAAFPGDGALIVRASSWGGATAGRHRSGPATSTPASSTRATRCRRARGRPRGGRAAGGRRRRADARDQRLSRVRVGHRGLPPPADAGVDAPLDGAHGADGHHAGVRGRGAPAVALRRRGGAEYQAMASLHQQLEPYNAMLMRQAQTTGSPSIRPLPLAFPQDVAAAAVAADRVHARPRSARRPAWWRGATNRDVHLPPGRWVALVDATRVYDGRRRDLDAPLGSPPFFARAGGLVPMLPDGIDTLVEANAPGVVTLASLGTEMRARAWPAGTASVVLDDASVIDVTDDAGGVTVSWESSGVVTNLTIDVDVRVRTGSSAPVTRVDTLSGGTLGAAGDAGAVQASATPAWAPGNPGHVWLRFVGPGSAVLH